jgi:acetyl-CoA carboxylase biotin carboxyl carrier protein
MPEPRHLSDRTAAARQADHASLARLSDSLVPALVAKLSASGLGELEVHEGDWKIRLRRGTSAAAPGGRRAERTRPTAPTAPERSAAHAAHGEHQHTGDRERGVATAPAVGVFKAIAVVGARVRAGDRLATVDLLGIPQDVVAPIDGVVVEVFIKNGEAVEYGEDVVAVEAPAPLHDHDEDDDAAGPEATA